MRNRKIQRKLAKDDKAFNINPKLGYSKPREMNDYDPKKRAYGSFESNSR